MEKNSTIQRMKLLEFFKDHPKAFSDIEQKRILDYEKYGGFEDMVPDLVREIYDELGFLSDDENIYLGFMKLLGGAFPYFERKLLEIGGGILPRLAKRISAQLTTGHITVVDPRLSTDEVDTPKMTLVRRMFHKDDSVDGHNLMIAFMPCGGAEPFIESATNNNVDFMLGFCEGGPHGDEFDFYEDAEEWLHSMMYLATRNVQQQHMGKIRIKTLEQYGDPYPVIYNER